MNRQQGFGYRAKAAAAVPLSPEAAEAQRILLEAQQAERRQRLLGGDGGEGGVAIVASKATTVTDPIVLDRSARIVARCLRTLAARRRGLWAALRGAMSNDGEVPGGRTSADAFSAWLSGLAAQPSSSCCQAPSGKAGGGWVWPWLHYAIFRAAAIATTTVRAGIKVGDSSAFSSPAVPLASVVFALLGAQQLANVRGVAAAEDSLGRSLCPLALAACPLVAMQPSAYNAASFLKAQLFGMTVPTTGGGSADGPQYLDAIASAAALRSRQIVAVLGYFMALPRGAGPAASRARLVSSHPQARSPLYVAPPPPTPPAPLSAPASAPGVKVAGEGNSSSGNGGGDRDDRITLEAFPPIELYTSTKVAGTVMQLLLAITATSAPIVAAASASCPSSPSGGGGGSAGASAAVNGVRLVDSRRTSTAAATGAATVVTKGTAQPTGHPPARDIAAALFRGRSDGFLLALVDGGDVSWSRAAASAFVDGSTTCTPKQHQSQQPLLALLAGITSGQMRRHAADAKTAVSPAPVLAAAHATMGAGLASLASLSGVDVASSFSSSCGDGGRSVCSAAQWVASQWHASGFAAAPYLPRTIDTGSTFDFSFAAKEEAEKGNTASDLAEIGNSFVQQQLGATAMLWRLSFGLAAGEIIAAATGTNTDNNHKTVSSTQQQQQQQAQTSSSSASSPAAPPRSFSHVVTNTVYHLSALLTNRCYPAMHAALRAQWWGGSGEEGGSRNEVEDYFDDSVAAAVAKSAVAVPSLEAMAALRHIVAMLGVDYFGGALAFAARRAVVSAAGGGEEQRGGAFLPIPTAVVADCFTAIGSDRRQTAMLSVLWTVDPLAAAPPPLPPPAFSAGPATYPLDSAALRSAAAQWLLLSLLGLGGAYADAAGVGFDTQYGLLLLLSQNVGGASSGDGGRGGDAKSIAMLAVQRLQWARRLAAARTKCPWEPYVAPTSHFPSSIPNILAATTSTAATGGDVAVTSFFSTAASINKERCVALATALWPDWLRDSVAVPLALLVPSACAALGTNSSSLSSQLGSAVLAPLSSGSIFSGNVAEKRRGEGRPQSPSPAEAAAVRAFIGLLEVFCARAPAAAAAEVSSSLSLLNSAAERGAECAQRVLLTAEAAAKKVSSSSSLSTAITAVPPIAPLSEVFWLRYCLPLLPIIDAWAVAVETPTTARNSNATASAAAPTNASTPTFAPQTDDQMAATRLLSLLPPSALRAAHAVLRFFFAHCVSYGLLVCDDDEITVSSFGQQQKGAAGANTHASSSSSAAVGIGGQSSAASSSSVGLPSVEVLRHAALLMNRVCFASIAHLHLPPGLLDAGSPLSPPSASSIVLLCGGTAATQSHTSFAAAASAVGPAFIEGIGRYLRGKESRPIPYTHPHRQGEQQSPSLLLSPLPLAAVVETSYAPLVTAGVGIGVGGSRGAVKTNTTSTSQAQPTTAMERLTVAAMLLGRGPSPTAVGTVGSSSSNATASSTLSSLCGGPLMCRRDGYRLRQAVRQCIRQLMDRANRSEKGFIPPHLRATAGGGEGYLLGGGGGGGGGGDQYNDDGTVAGFFDRLLFAATAGGASRARERGLLTAASSRLWCGVDGLVKERAELAAITRAAAVVNTMDARQSEIAEALSVLPGGGSHASSSPKVTVTFRAQHMLHEMPHAVPFPIRAAYLRLLIAADRRRHQTAIQSLTPAARRSNNAASRDHTDSSGASFKLGLRIRRAHIYSDAFTQLMGLVVGPGGGSGAEPASPVTEGLLRARWNITFVDSVSHAVEAGIDHGGVFKEFIELALKQCLDPSYGLFVAVNTAAASNGGDGGGGGASGSSQQQHFSDLYPNPHARHFLAAMGAGIRHAGGATGSAAAAYTDAEMRLHYRFVGLLVAKAVYEGVVLNAPFAPFFLQSVLGRGTCLDDLRAVDPQQYKSLQLLKAMPDCSDACLYFAAEEEVLGTLVTVDLIEPNGRDVLVTNENVVRYVHLMANYRLSKSIRVQTEAFVQGMGDVFGNGGGASSSSSSVSSSAAPQSIQWLRLFNAVELLQLISGTAARLDVADLRRNAVLAGGGYSGGDRTIGLLWEVLEEMSADDQARFLQFCTGSSRPPLLGFAAMSPPFTIRRAVDADGSGGLSLGTGGSIFNVFVDIDRLPSASTCFNLLKLPPYMSKANLKAKLLQAIRSGAGFDLS